MTTKPRAKKFRIRMSQPSPLHEAPEGAEAAEARSGAPKPRARPRRKVKPPADAAPKPQPEQTEDGFGSEAFPTARSAKAPPKPGKARKLQPDDAGQAKPTGRQLRMARRLAHRHGMKPKSDEEAVEMLKAKGIDPFAHSNMIQLVVPENKEKPKPEAKVQLPQKVTPAETLPAEPQPRSREDEIAQIQAGIVRRRRKRVLLLGARLSLFVFLPTMIVAFYYFAMATPMYATKSEFVIQQADQQSGGGLGGMLSGTGFATSQDSITVQSYLQSREAMLRLDEDVGFKAHFSQPAIDFWQRLDADATNEEAYRHFNRKVKIGYDPTEGLIRMEVIAADPDVSAEFSRALITYAEEQVDTLSLRLREDQMRGAMQAFADAEARMTEAQAEVLRLQEQLGVLDPASETAAIMGQISSFETQLAEKRLELEQLMDNAAPNAARVAGTEGDIERLTRLIATLRAQLTEGMAGSGSMARVTAELRMAEVDLQTRTLMMQESLQHLESARIEANRQVRYLSTGVNPIPPDEATYPRSWWNTLIAFCAFAGIYLMVSLTASILREQVSG